MEKKLNNKELHVWRLFIKRLVLAMKKWYKELDLKVKNNKYKDIKIQEKDYEKLMNFKREWNCSNVWEVVEELIDYFEADNAKEDPYYCDNCGDYHD